MPSAFSLQPAASLLDWFDTSRLRRLRTAVLRWYSKHGRDLPWRENRDPYRIWISEAMLQQTTVAAVKPYFERFLTRFPTVQDLASAPEDDVLRLWEGLGYYSRARNLHRAARVVANDLSGAFPRDVPGLVELPGVGRYTAGAIASFAFDARAPIVEANTLRLYSRLLGYGDDPRSKDGQTILWEFAERILPQRDCGAFNHAVMDLGAMVCRPVDPDCPACPLKTCCRAFTEGTQNAIPLKAKRPELTDVVDASVVIHSGKRILLRRRGPDERWSGLWDFPRLTLDVDKDAPNSTIHRFAFDKLVPWIQEHTDLETTDWTPLTDIRHGVTRYRIRLIGFLARSLSVTTPKIAASPDLQWVGADDIVAIPLSMTGRKLANAAFDVLNGRKLFPA